MFEQLPTPAVIAHRGASRQAPENTLKAFRLALSQNADGLELDVRLTRDHQLIVFHDPDLSRTTTGTGRVSRTPYSIIRTLQTDQGQKVPLLEEVLDEFAGTLPINIELKTSHLNPRLITAKTAGLLGNFPGAPVLISSFNPFCLAAFHRISPSVPLGWILPGGKLTQILAFRLSPHLPLASIHLPYQQAELELINKFQARGLKVLAYTVNDPAAMVRLLKNGLDGFFTDDPALARNTINMTHKVE